jgi:hypothetical protein
MGYVGKSWINGRILMVEMGAKERSPSKPGELCSTMHCQLT